MKKHKYEFTIGWIFPAIVLAIVTGCKTPKEFQRPASIQLPERDKDIADTSIISDLSVTAFFSDPYLQVLIDTALQNNWDAEIALQRIEIARADYRKTRSPLLPAVNAVVSAGVNRFSKNSFNPPTKSTNTGFDIFTGLQSSWEIDIWNRLKNRRRASFLRLLSTGQGLKLLRTNLVAEVAQRYYSLLTLDSVQAIVSHNLVLQEEALRVISIQKEGGRATELAVKQFKAQLLNTQSLQIEYRQQMIETENQLNGLLGRLPQPINRSAAVADTFFKSTYVSIPSALLLRRPDVQQAELDLQAFETDIQVARAAFLPALNLTSYIGLNATDPVKLINPGSIVYGIVGGLTAPLFNRIAIESNYERSMAAAQEAFLNYQKTINASYTEVATNLTLINNLAVMHQLKQQQTKTLQDAVSVSKDLYLAGYASYLEVIIAQGSVLQAELELIFIKNRMYQSQINLYRSLGGGWR